MSQRKSFDITLFISSLIAGLAAWLIGWILYVILIEKIPTPLLIGVEFLMLYIILTGTVMIVSYVNGSLDDVIFFLDGMIQIVLALVIGGILIFGISVLFQFIYGLNSETVNVEPTSYIFVIDDSGSMESNDPENLRYKAIEEVLEDMPNDFPYMIYRFSDNVEIVRNMAPVSDGIGKISVTNSGGTRIKAALEQIYEDYGNGVWSDSVAPKIILLTDGYAQDMGFLMPYGGTLKKFAKAHISISTVGLGQVDMKLMQRIADATNGVFLNVSDAGLFKDAMGEAAVRYSSDRDLLSYRNMREKNWVYAFLRIVFLTILGTFVGVMMIFASTKEDDALLILISSIGKSLIGSIFMELGIQVIGIPWQVMWLVYWWLVASLLTLKNEKYLGIINSNPSTLTTLNEYQKYSQGRKNENGF